MVVLHADLGSSPSWYNELLSDFRCGGVSYFFAVSGYFFAKRYGQEPLSQWWLREMRKRLRTLGIPYVLWCAIGWNGGGVLSSFGLVCVMPEANYPLWYIKHLLVFCAISPLVIWPLQRLSQTAFLFPAFLLAVVGLPWAPIPFKFGFVLSFLMFAFGIALALRGQKPGLGMKTIPALFALWLTFHALHAAFAGKCGFVDWPLRVYSATTLVLLLWVAVECIGEVRSLPAFCGMTFFVYCSHCPMLRHLRLFSALGTTGVVLDGLLAAAACLAVAAILRRWANPVYRVLSGGRC